MMQITFPDGTKREYKEGITPIEIIKKDIGEGLARAALAAKINDKLIDLNTPIKESCSFKVITFKDKEGVEIFRHSTAHVLAHAVIQLFPKVKPTIGPVVEEGFYYDFDADPFKPEDIKKIEEKMHNIVNQDLPFERIELTKAEAQKLFKNNPYKLELIEEFGKDLTAYRQGDFIDLCRGPHVSSTGKIKAFKLTKIAGAYWRGDIKNKQLQRVYGISFPDSKELNDYLKMIEEAKKRDHTIIGKQLDLFSIHEEGPGFTFWHNNGMILRNKLIDYWREEHRKAGYIEVSTPTMLNRVLWEKSGHWKLYQDMMYTTRIDDQDYAIKPMNCPGGMLIYKTKVHSYREMPLRVGELGHVHRHELSGVLHGLFRVRAFTQDDAHIFCIPEQLEDEIINVISLIKKMLAVFGFEKYFFTLSVRSEEKKDKYLGDDTGWKKAEDSLKSALNKLKIPFNTLAGEAKFYGPSLDVQIADALGRRWQCSTIQVDFNLPERFDITYEGKDGKQHRPFILHRVVYGSLERFIGVLIEHFAGRFPLWISPSQIIILTVADRFNDYALELKKKFEEHGLRADIDLRAESIPKKVRDAQVQQIPLIITVGEREIRDKTISVRTLDGKLADLKVEDFIKKVKENIEKKEISVKF
ncbi:MAG: threonine--tRNA ligase [Candidatus Woesearchaeota archaeon]|nr:threonine--tRNA ligase [Candidatus Woesearchaeota archaeon]